MLKKTFIVILIIFQIFRPAHAHPWKPDHFVIIDTDCGFDDFRAINLLLASSSVRILAVISSNGVLSPEEGYYKLKDMLNSYHHGGILLGMNDSKSSFRNDCLPAREFVWGTAGEENNRIPGHLDIINEVLKNSKEKITFINLGNLGTYVSAIEKIPGFKNRVIQSVWTCNTKNIRESFNYKSDTAAYHLLTKKNEKLNLIDGQTDRFEYSSMMNQLKDIRNIYARNIIRSLEYISSPYAQSLYDENAVLYLHKPDFFVTENETETKTISVLAKNVNSEYLYNYYHSILDGKTSRQNQVFSVFPMDTSYYTDEIQAIMPWCLDKYGRNEWIATVMANEMHRHLGIYAVIGTKMGMRAREYFGAGVDEMMVISHAGNNPPFSCMNDGLQISTGATLGHGLIKITEDDSKLPKADFVYMNRKISISLKEEYRKRVENEIRNLVVLHGLDSNLYWDMVRKLAIDYWKYWDRHEIFILEEITNL
jgi:formylmethanofuran dehydrogenase subunit E/inosine-uridine nucleoside N-ribohydrolase